MQQIKVKSIVEGDILSRDVIIKDFVLFEAGTVFVKSFIEVMEFLDVDTVYIEDYTGKKFASTKISK